MAGMWQLPQLQAAPDTKSLCTVKHSITVTNYTVRVYLLSAIAPEQLDATTRHWKRQWVPLASASALPLTGLARKILRRLRSLELTSI